MSAGGPSLERRALALLSLAAENGSGRLSLPVLSVLFLLGSGAVAAELGQAGHREAWSVHEIALTAASDYVNPYTDVEVDARFSGPDGTSKQARGFWDGGRDFKVRFTPTLPGEWRCAITSVPADSGLTRSETFIATAPRPGSHGFLRRDSAHPASFIRDDGSRIYLLGTTYYGLVANARAGGRWQESVTNLTRFGMNKVRLCLHSPGGPASSLFYTQTSPFLAGAPERLDLEHWRVLDRVLRFMGEQGVLAELILFPYRTDNASVGALGQDQRYLRYALARYAAFPNVMWCLVNEWNYSVLSPGYWNDLGRLSRAEDPWSVEGGRLRALSIHQQTRPDWNFAGESWPSHAVLQFGVRNQGRQVRVGDEWKPPPDGVQAFQHGDAWGNFSIVRNWTGSCPIVNDEYGYIGEPKDNSGGPLPDGTFPRYTREKHRQTLWGIAVGGGYAAAGDKNDYADGRPYFSGNWHDVPEYGDIRRLADFFTAPGREYWKMAPHNEVIIAGSRVYALAEPGRQYILYAAAGGKLTVDLPPGRYAASRFDPRTGAETSLPDITGGAGWTFTCPDRQDWVLRLSSVHG